MVLPRASAAPAALGRTVFRRAATQNRNQAWRQITRRHYASEHGGQKSSELPWIIGSVGFTVPAAVWLFNQGSSGVHHPEAAIEKQEGGTTDEEGKDDEAPQEDNSDESPQEKADDGGDESKRASKDEEGHDGEAAQEDNPDSTPQEDADDSGDEKKRASQDEEGHDDEAAQENDSGKDKDDSKAEAKDDSKDESKDDSDSKGANYTKEGRKLSDDGYELPGPNAPGQINKPSGGKMAGEQGKGSRERSETQSEKDQHSKHSGAQNPYLDDDEKSKKGEGMKETAKIHGTVNSRRDARGDGEPNE